MSRARKITLRALISVGALILIFASVILIRRISCVAIKDTGLPRLDVYTEDGAKIKSKEDYLNCTVSLTSDEEEYSFDSLSAGIRGRGNTTWKFFPKKPYRIKFDKKVSMFGEAKNKSWVLLAMYNDFSLTKDSLGFALADAMGTEDFVPCSHYVDLYINGKYAGIYMLTDQVQENSGRLDVEEDFTAEDIEVPFLVELDSYAEDEGAEGEAWFRIGDRLYTVKYPEADQRYNQAQFDYIVNYISKVDALFNKPGVTLAELSEYVDIDSFIDYYIVQETMGQIEINWKSVYMSKSTDGKLKMGPVWDFDWSCDGPHAWLTAKSKYKDDIEGLRSGDNWFGNGLKNCPELARAVAERFAEVKPRMLSVIDEFEGKKDLLAQAARKDWRRWHFFRLSRGYNYYYDLTLSWCSQRIQWLDEEFSSYLLD